MLAAVSARVERSPAATRARLIEAAEQLFAARGIDAVSLREINRLSGARNAVAVQYHFDDRSGVLNAVLAKHRPAVEAARHALLDQLEGQDRQEAGRPVLRDFAAALVRPLAAKLADPDGGTDYLQIFAEVVNRPRPVFPAADDADERDSIVRWRRLVEPHLDEESVRLHRRFTAIRFTAVELGRRAASAPHTDDRLFVSHLIDLVTALLAARIAPETQRLVEERDTRAR